MKKAGWVLAAIALVGCRQILGIDDRQIDTTASDAAVACVGADAFAPACGACMAGACCGTIASCQADATCAPLLACLANCRGEPASIAACRVKCGRTLPTSFDEVAAQVMSCQAAHCADACGLTCGGAVHSNALCESCAAGACCAETAACSSDAACLALSTCIAACAPRDGPCVLGCTGRFRGGSTLRDRAEACIAQSCAGACYDAVWACLGKSPVVRPPEGGPVTLVAVDFVTGSPRAGVTVGFCRDGQSACEGPLATTNAAGEVRLESSALSGGCLRFSGPDVRDTCIVHAPGATEGTVPLISGADFARLFPPPLPAIDTGIVLAYVHDCAYAPGSSASLSSNVPARFLYWRRASFVADGAGTDGSGLAAVLDLAPGARIVRAELAPSLPAVDQQELFVRAGVITITGLGP